MLFMSKSARKISRTALVTNKPRKYLHTLSHPMESAILHLEKKPTKCTILEIESLLPA